MTAPSAKPSSLPNLGPAMDRYLSEIGVETAEDLRGLGAVEAYARLRMVLPRGLSILGLYAMQAALENRALQDLSAAERASLRAAVGQKAPVRAAPKRRPNRSAPPHSAG